MWREVFRIAMAIELGLVALEKSVHPTWLPIGGGHLEQIAILFIGGFVVLEAIEFFLSLRGGHK